MCLLFDTIKVDNGVIYHPDFHERRMNRSRRELFGQQEEIELEDVLVVPPSATVGLHKCRVVYGRKIESIAFTPYQRRQVRTLQLVEDSGISYEHKFVDRRCFERHLQSTQADDILIVKNGLVTDTSFSNIVFCDGNGWITPGTPLLKGTQREALLQRGVIREREVRPADLEKFDFAILINAMMDLETGPRIEIASIIPVRS